MKIFKVMIVFVLVLLLQTGVLSGSAQARSLKIINNSGETIYAIYAVSRNYGGWGNDILTNPGTLRNGYYQIVNFSNGTRYVKVKTYFSGDRYKYWDSIDLNNVSTITVTPYRG